MILLKNKKITLKCYPQFPQISNLFPIDHARKFIPKWWKNLDVEANDSCLGKIPTIKSCYGFTDLYSRGFIIPLWRDCVVFYDKNGIENIQIPTEENINQYFTYHANSQFNGYLPQWHHLKFITPWLLETKDLIPFLMTEVGWSRENPLEYFIPQGTLEFKYQHAAHLNVFFPPTNSKKKVEFFAETPLIHLIPLTEHEVEIEICDYNPKKFQELLPHAWTFKNLYKKTRNLLEKK